METTNHQGLEWLNEFFGEVTPEMQEKAIKREAHNNLVRINTDNAQKWARAKGMTDVRVVPVHSPCQEFECGDAFGTKEVPNPFVFVVRYRGTRHNYTYIVLDIMQERILHAYTQLAYQYTDFDGCVTYRSQPIGNQAHTVPYNNWLLRKINL